MRPIIEFENFSFQYDSQQQPTLHDINLTIYEGEKICIVGPSGSGKSTLAHCLNGLIPERYEGKMTGKLVISGQLATSFSLFQRSKKIGTVMQDTDSQFIGLTVAEDIAFALENEATTQQTMKQRVKEAARAVQMEDHLKKEIFALSGGQKQRTAMAGVLVNDIDILLFDEPLANLDPVAGKEAMALIEKLHHETKKTIILVEHRLEDVLTESVDRIILMDNGTIVADCAPEEMLRKNILATYSIREPLYVRLLKYAGIPIETVPSIDRIDNIPFGQFKEPLLNWLQLLPKKSTEHTQTTPVLHMNDLSFRYEPFKPLTLKKINGTIYEGEMISIVGTNGAGKSTLAKCLCGFEKVKKGSLFISGEDVAQWSLKKRAEQIGYVLQNPNQMFSETKIFDEVAFGLRNRSIDEDIIKQRVHATLKTCGLYPFRNWPIAALSYGQKRRLAIACILVLEPKIIVLDEPTAGQDFYHSTAIMNFLTTLAKRGTTIVIITHDMHLMTEYTNRTLVIDHGQILADDTPAKILNDEEIVQAAHLKPSSLATVASQIGYASADELAEKFIAYERSLRQ